MLRFYLFLEQFVPEWMKRLIPQRLRIALGYELKVRRQKGRWQQAAVQGKAKLTHGLNLPPGETVASLRDYLASFQIEGEEANQERQGYLSEALVRFLYTLQMIPRGEGRLLEIGANPYFMSLLIGRFTDYDLSYINYFGPAYKREDKQVVRNSEEQIEFSFHNLNIEVEEIPYPENHFDVVLMGEVLEHFTNDPLYVLLNIKRVLKPNGYLVLTTPNVNRLANVARIIAGFNIYDPYSGYGPYGRHNREYTLDEVTRLLTHAGFQIEQAFSSDVHENHTSFYADRGRVMDLVSARSDTLGQYLFVRARNTQPANEGKPTWLYRSYPAAELADDSENKLARCLGSAAIFL